MDKLSSGIDGFDEVTGGGFPCARTSLVAGGAGSGKSLLMLTAAVRGAAEAGIPAVFVSFEERPEDIIENAASIGLDIEPLIEAGDLRLEHITEPVEYAAEAGDYTLAGLQTRIDLAIKQTNAKLLAIDTIEALFGMFGNEQSVRREIVRLFRWLKDQGVTTLISGETSDKKFTRRGLEEYVSDCVVFLDQRIVGDVATRRLRVVKYRGSEHGSNEFPFLIDSQGITVMPLSSARLDYESAPDTVSTGLDGLDAALEGGFRRGSSVLVTGASGTGKSLLSAHCAAAALQRGEKAAIFNFEESPSEYLANVKSAGVDLEAAHESGQLIINSTRPALLGLEQHLVEKYRLIEECEPEFVAVDPLSSLADAGTDTEVYRTMVRLIDHLKRKQITTVFTAEASGEPHDSGLNISSIIDTWIELEWDRTQEPFHRRLLVRKKRGSGHAKGFVVFTIGDDGFSVESVTDEH